MPDYAVAHGQSLILKGRSEKEEGNEFKKKGYGNVSKDIKREKGQRDDGYISYYLHRSEG